MKTAVFDLTGKKIEDITLNKEVFGGAINEALMAQAVRVYLANQREAAAQTKTRSEVKRTTKKVYRQKGTGGARHGSRRAPIYVGGGVAHGPTGEQNYSLRLPQKMKIAALKSALSLKASVGKVIAVSGLETMKEPKTKDITKLLEKITNKNYRKVALIYTPGMNVLVKSSRNLAQAAGYNVNRLTTYDVIHNDTLIVSLEALEDLTKRLTK